MENECKKYVHNTKSNRIYNMQQPGRERHHKNIYKKQYWINRMLMKDYWV